jgi:hypothetical protein
MCSCILFWSLKHFSQERGGGEIEIKEGGKLCDVMHINPLQCLRSLFAYLLFQITSALSFSAECCYSFMQITEEQIHLYHLCILLRFLALSLLIENKKNKTCLHLRALRKFITTSHPTMVYFNIDTSKADLGCLWLDDIMDNRVCSISPHTIDL